ncbi:O-antigen ligase family protein [Rheinheimera sp.]|uniref:O-antigen ligase family protein n=1 Tax=Rheinheimera sp. TaxID=1869214 RepID=UPI00307DDCD1
MGVVIMAFCWVLAFLLPSFAVLPDVVWRLNGFFAHSQRLALFSAASALIATVFYLNALKSKEYNDIISTRILKFIIFFSFVTLAATQARAFTMSFMITYALLLYAHYKSHVKVVYIIFIITSSFIVYANIDFIMETFSRGDVADASLTGRVPTWLFAIELIEEQPLYGYGFGSFFSDLTIEPGRQYVSPHAHNSWINASLETGYVGAILMSLFLVFSISNAIKYQKVTKKLSYSLFIIIFILFCGLTGVVIGGKVTTLLGFSLLVYSIEMRALKNAC